MIAKTSALLSIFLALAPALPGQPLAPNEVKALLESAAKIEIETTAVVPE